MCTAINFTAKDHYFGRNLDLEYHYNEEVVITPRNYPFHFRNTDSIKSHYGIIGIATVIDGYPLYYDAANEFGLAMAGLNFPGNAFYPERKDGLINITPFEFIPYILSQCKSVEQTGFLIKQINICSGEFRDDMPLTPLHWIVSDKKCSIVIEPLKDGIRIYENPVGILSNNPPFDYHLYNLANYMTLSASEPENRISGAVELLPYSRGMAAIGLPGDLSSASRFVRAAFVKLNATHYDAEDKNVEQFFHILSSVEQQSGCVKVKNGNVSTVYASCCNTSKGIYYYKTYLNSHITAVHLHKENLNSNRASHYPLRFSPDFLTEIQNQRM